MVIVSTSYLPLYSTGGILATGLDQGQTLGDGAQNSPIGTMGRLYRITPKKGKKGEEGKS